MTVLSQVNAQQFSSQVKRFFPDGVFFNPVDYLKPFNEYRHSVGLAELGESTFKKYLAVVCDTHYFPELLRARNDSKSPYYYCVDRSETKSKKSPSLVETAKREGGRKPSSASSGPLSPARLALFGENVSDLMGPGYNKVSSLRNRYNKFVRESDKKLRSLTTQTFSYYMSVLCRKGVVSGLSRRRGSHGRFEYCLASATYKTISFEKESPTPRQDSKPVRAGCTKCHSPNPRKAKFCMECGNALGVRVKAVLQERVLSIPFAAPTDVDARSVKKWVSDRLEVSLESEEGVFSAIVDVKEDSRG